MLTLSATTGANDTDSMAESTNLPLGCVVPSAGCLIDETEGFGFGSRREALGKSIEAPRGQLGTRACDSAGESMSKIALEPSGRCTVGRPLSIDARSPVAVSLATEFRCRAGNGKGLRLLFGRTVATSGERILAGAKGTPTPGNIMDESRPDQLGVGLLDEGIGKNDSVDVR
jgi:hypothetical protein